MRSQVPLCGPAAAGSFRAVHRQFRRVRWFLLLGALILYAIAQIIITLLVQRFNLTWRDGLIDWSLAVLIGVGFTIGIARWEERWVAQVDALEARRRTAERALLQLEATQATARTVAHELNQPLTIIRGYTELLRTTPRAERDDADLDRIIVEVDRAAALVRQLLQVTHYATVPTPMGLPMLDLGGKAEA
jgi:signal transduction histidine kinase